MFHVTYVVFEIPEAVIGRTVERAKMHSDKSNEGFWHTGMPLLAAGAMFSLAVLTTTRGNPYDSVLASG